MVHKKRILVTGASGQLGRALKELACEGNMPFEWNFMSSSQLDITDKDAINGVFNKEVFDYCINTAAYTKVDLAEKEIALAEKVNTIAVGYLAQACDRHATTLLHISTDFVFDGQQQKPYTEMDVPAPLSQYGRTKYEGEQQLRKICPAHYILRTSWLYSTHGNNFYTTMLRLGRERDTLSVVNDQIGTPTHAADLAAVLVKILDHAEVPFGTYHYSHLGQGSWYDFARAIFEGHGMGIAVSPIPTSAYPLPAKRPPYSVLDKTKLTKVLGLNIPQWEEGLESRIKGAMATR